MKLNKLAGATSNIFQIFIADSTSATGKGLTGLVFNSGSLTAYFHRDTDTTATVIALVTMTAGTFTSKGFVEIDATNMPGWYQFCPPDTALAAGAKSVAFHLKGATNMADLPIEVQLTAYDPDTAPATAPTNFSSQVIDASGRVDVSKIAGTSQTARDLGASVLLSAGTGTGQISLTAGAVTVGTLNDKTGMSLTQTFPANFAALSVSAGGIVDGNVKQINGTTVNGNGAGTPWGP